MSANIEYCPTCGTKLEGSMTYNFCPHCGANLSAVETEPNKLVVTNTIRETLQPDIIEHDDDKSSPNHEKIAFIIKTIIFVLAISLILINAIMPKYDVIALTEDNYKQFLQVYTEDVVLVPKSNTSQKSEYRLSLVIHSLNDNYIFDNVIATVNTGSYLGSDYYLSTSGFLKVSCTTADTITAKILYLNDPYNYIMNISGTVKIPR